MHAHSEFITRNLWLLIVISVAMVTADLVKEVLEGDRVLRQEMLRCLGKHSDLEQKPAEK